MSPTVIGIPPSFAIGAASNCRTSVFNDEQYYSDALTNRFLCKRFTICLSAAISASRRDTPAIEEQLFNFLIAKHPQSQGLLSAHSD